MYVYSDFENVCSNGLILRIWVQMTFGNIFSDFEDMCSDDLLLRICVEMTF